MYSTSSFGRVLKCAGPMFTSGPSACRTPRVTAAYMPSNGLTGSTGKSEPNGSAGAPEASIEAHAYAPHAQRSRVLFAAPPAHEAARRDAGT